MAIYSLPTWDAPYIYHIQVGNKLYIGQATKEPTSLISQSRIYEHFNAAYHKHYGYGAKDSEKQIHNEMQKHKMCEVEVFVYPKSKNYGIPNFEDLVNQFLQEWTPVPDQDLDKLKLDLAEIFHIQWGLQSGKELVNNEMGGSKVDWAINGTIKNIKDKKQNRKKKVLMHTNKPATATMIMQAPADDLNTINNTMRFLFDIVFSDKWKDYYPNYCRNNNIPVDQNITEPWSEYFSNIIFPYIDEILFEELKEGLFSKLQRKNNPAKKQARDELYKIIKRGFVTPRIKALKDIIHQAKPNSKSELDFEITLNDGVDFNSLAGYITSAVARLILSLFDDRPIKKNSDITKAEQAFANLKNLKPANFLASYDQSKLRTDDTRGQWLKQIPEPIGISIQDWVKEYSLFFFDQRAKKAIKDGNALKLASSQLKKGNLVNSSDGFIEEKTKGQSVINMTYLSTQEGLGFHYLSTRIYDQYKIFAPAYLGDWWEFYRPMVSYWRFRRNSPEFIVETTGEGEDEHYSFQYWLWQGDIQIMYHMSNLAVFNSNQEPNIY